MPVSAPDQLLRPTEVAVRLGVSRSKVYALIQQNRIPSVRVLGSVRVPERALERWIERNTVDPADTPGVARSPAEMPMGSR
jgi:excisionase family DNA binding protein